MTRIFFAIILIALSFSKVFGQANMECPFKLSKGEIDIILNNDQYQFNDSTYYSCYKSLIGKMSKDSLLAAIYEWEEKNKNKVQLQKIVLTDEEQKLYNTKTQVVIVLWHKFIIEPDSKKRQSIIRSLTKNCR